MDHACPEVLLFFRKMFLSEAKNKIPEFSFKRNILPIFSFFCILYPTKMFWILHNSDGLVEQTFKKHE